jgi:biopolymer transport protein ExbD
MARKRRFETEGGISFINMTPLIDVFLFLLIVYMLVVPLAEYNVNVKPPEFNATPIPDKDNLYVNLTSSNTITFQNQSISKDDLTLRLKEMFMSRPKIVVLLRADGRCAYNEVMDVMKAIKTSGVDNISLITQAESN